MPRRDPVDHGGAAAVWGQGPGDSGSSSDRHTIEQVSVAGGRFAMGDGFGEGYTADGESPVHTVDVAAFSIDATSVTVADFVRFIDDTGYVTESEQFGYSAVFWSVLAADEADVVGQPEQTPWWLGVKGADWRHPDGPRSSIDDRLDHPVTQVSWNDAQAYCAWAARRLPTEAEWEFAARVEGAPGRFPWGDDLLVDGVWQANIWQGEFPTSNSGDDGHVTTAPVRTYRPHGGLWQMVGNVWEWCSDWFSPRTYAVAAKAEVTIDPPGPSFGNARVMRGGSFLCHDSYCYRYRNAARSSNTPDSAAANVGFRTVALG